ncbi:MAG: sigma-70 family RNA polymerase sigma factor [Mycobacteriaceae bacterium]
MVVEEPAESMTPPGFDEIYEREVAAVTRLAFLVVRDRAAAEELAQEAFLRLYANFDSVTNPPGFLRTVVARLASTRRSRHTMEQERLALVPEPLPIVDGFDIDETWSALGRIAPDRAAVLILRFYEDLDYSQIGEIVDCSAATVRSRVRRGLTDLRKEIS